MSSKPTSIARFVMLLVACCVITACSQSARQKTIRATYDVTNASADAVLAFSNTHELEIVKTATSADGARADLQAFRAKIDHAVKSIDGLYRAIATAALLNDDRSLIALVAAAKIVTEELRDLGVTLPGGGP